MITLNAVSKSFGSASVLKNFHLEIPSGKTIALLGLSGSGKTTVLKLIAGIHLADQGQIRVDELEVNSTNIKKIREKIGYVIQDGGLFPHLTAIENIELMAKERGWSTMERKNRLEELADLTKLPTSLLKKYPKALSGGQRQRVGIIRAMFLNPDVYLLDEPLGALDPITRSDLQEELQIIFSQMKKTVLLVTHDLHEAAFLADAVYLLNKGQIIQQGTMQEIVNNPNSDFVKKFVNAQRGASLN
ncbi:MAG: ATP-binding cassette domain-containing protein [Oligoflexia bacterium]|nr:ATP-binding cassette domain-containing protein [Oligoflexia bacterium]